MSLFAKTCLAGGKHAFEARYDTIPAGVALMEAAARSGATQLSTTGHHSDQKKYVCDVCRWCGAVVKRGAESAQLTKQAHAGQGGI